MPLTRSYNPSSLSAKSSVPTLASVFRAIPKKRSIAWIQTFLQSFLEEANTPNISIRLLEHIVQIIISSSPSCQDVVSLANKRFPMLHYFCICLLIFSIFFLNQDSAAFSRAFEYHTMAMNLLRYQRHFSSTLPFLFIFFVLTGAQHVWH